MLFVVEKSISTLPKSNYICEERIKLVQNQTNLSKIQLESSRIRLHLSRMYLTCPKSN